MPGFPFTSISVDLMDIPGALQNGGISLTLSFFACPAVLFVYLFVTRSRSTFLRANVGTLLGLAVELFLLAIVAFVAAVGVLAVFHSRFEQHDQQLSELGAVTGRKLTSPFDFAVPIEHYEPSS